MRKIIAICMSLVLLSTSVVPAFATGNERKQIQFVRAHQIMMASESEFFTVAGTAVGVVGGAAAFMVFVGAAAGMFDSVGKESVINSIRGMRVWNKYARTFQRLGMPEEEWAALEGGQIVVDYIELSESIKSTSKLFDPIREGGNSSSLARTSKNVTKELERSTEKTIKLLRRYIAKYPETAYTLSGMPLETFMPVKTSLARAIGRAKPRVSEQEIRWIMETTSKKFENFEKAVVRVEKQEAKVAARAARKAGRAVAKKSVRLGGVAGVGIMLVTAAVLSSTEVHARDVQLAEQIRNYERTLSDEEVKIISADINAWPKTVEAYIELAKQVEEGMEVLKNMNSEERAEVIGIFTDMQDDAETEKSLHANTRKIHLSSVPAR